MSLQGDWKNSSGWSSSNPSPGYLQLQSQWQNPLELPNSSRCAPPKTSHSKARIHQCQRPVKGSPPRHKSTTACRSCPSMLETNYRDVEHDKSNWFWSPLMLACFQMMPSCGERASEPERPHGFGPSLPLQRQVAFAQPRRLEAENTKPPVSQWLLAHHLSMVRCEKKSLSISSTSMKLIEIDWTSRFTRIQSYSFPNLAQTTVAFSNWSPFSQALFRNLGF